MHTQTLRELIGRSAHEFDDSFPGTPQLFRSPHPPDELLSVEDVDQMLADGRLRVPFLEISSNDKLVSPSAFTFGGGLGLRDLPDTVRVAGLLNDGCTLVLNMLHLLQSPAAALARRLEAGLGRPVRLNAFLTPPQSQGFRHHYDTDSAFLVQVTGHKRWELFVPYFPWPLEDQKTPRGAEPAEVKQTWAGEPDLVFELSPGDVLWMPRGWVHNGYSIDSLSFHLTYGIGELSEFRIVEAATALLRLVSVELRRELPPGFQPDSAMGRNEIARTLETLRDRLRSLDPDDLAELLKLERDRRSTPKVVRPIAETLLARS